MRLLPPKLQHYLIGGSLDGNEATVAASAVSGIVTVAIVENYSLFSLV